ncbi:hypothetical protein R0K19_25895, partial [Bacillus sp. SIMBA_161]
DHGSVWHDATQRCFSGGLVQSANGEDFCPPGRALGKAVRFFRDLPAVNLRRRLGAADDVPRPAAADDAPEDAAYPAYFLQNFH